MASLLFRPKKEQTWRAPLLMSYESNVEEFLKVKSQFQLGDLVTESVHPATKTLSQQAKNDVRNALSLLKDVDLEALKKLQGHLPNLKALHNAVKDTLQKNGKIFLGGCGATGRLSLVCEFLWRWQNSDPKLQESVVGFMAGGDVALIASIEKFEDFPEFGARQLRELGFSKNDLFLGSTEGGETPFVIGATEEASRISERKPFFLYCNPDSILIQKIERSRNVISNPRIEKINLTVGPMAITGSTRMQASTVLMYAISLCLEHYQRDFSEIEKRVQSFITFFEAFHTSELERFITKEASFYKNDEFVFYDTTPEYGITVLTDTTERSPTFSLFPFENEQDQEIHPSLCYLLFKNEVEAKSAWHSLLQRPPRTFHWKEVTNRTNQERLLGFDFSNDIIKKRHLWHQKPSHHFEIIPDQIGVHFKLENAEHHFDFNDLPFLERHVLLKMMLNSLSTLIMGRLDRYDGNIMTWVRSSNYKLIDRTIRYVKLLQARENTEIAYEEIAKKIFELKDHLRQDQPMVLELFKTFKT
jgi:N-acetylmuramic acid 6-phosphate etherase